jgi:predicted DCC family thiol-disulfide oxidoreductase YuxK
MDLDHHWIFYDEDCGICRALARRWESRLRRRGYILAALQSPWVSQRLDLPQEELLRDLRLLMSDGRQFIGADAYREIFQHVWWLYPLYLFSILPGGRFLFDRTYRFVADNRHRFSQSCRRES